MVYDAIIIGLGPAGLSAGIYCARKKMKTLILGGDLGGMAAQSGQIENYLGYDLISGVELTEKFYEHLTRYKDDVELKTGAWIDRLERKNNQFTVKTNQETFTSKTVIIASGKLPKKLKVPGEEEFYHKGVTYCATCDAPLFQGKNVAVIGGNNSALDAILSLIPIAKKIYALTINDEFWGDKIMFAKASKADNVEFIYNAFTQKIEGEMLVKSLTYKVKQGAEKKLDVEGIFVEIGSDPSVAFVKDLVKLNEYQEIIIDSFCKTNIGGLFAAGDVTIVAQKQIIVAAGEGCKAALSAFSYLNSEGDINDY